MTLGRYLHFADHYPAIIREIDKHFPKKVDFKDIKFQIKIKGIRKIGKKNSITISVFGYKTRKNVECMYQINAAKKIMFICYQKKKKGKGNIFLSKVLILSCIIIHYTVIENTFAVVVYKLLVQGKY